jgi:hypothetical protein
LLRYFSKLLLSLIIVEELAAARATLSRWRKTPVGRLQRLESLAEIVQSLEVFAA